MAVKRTKSFTLIELLIATAIFTAVIVSVYSAFYSGLFGYRNIAKAIDTYQSARLILERMGQEIRNSFIYSEKDTRFSGSAGEISFLTPLDSYKDKKLRRDYVFVRYSLEGSKLMRLCRVGAEALNSDSETKAQEMKADVTKLSFGYIKHDEKDNSLKDPVDAWTDTTKLPAAVKITLVISGEQFERTVFLPPIEIASAGQTSA